MKNKDNVFLNVLTKVLVFGIVFYLVEWAFLSMAQELDFLWIFGI